MKRLLCAVVMACALPAGATEQFAPTQAELMLLPPYCADRIGKGVSANSPAVAQLGRENWLHIHHYCFALNFVSRANRALKPKDKSYNLERAEANFGYVIKATQPQFAMRPQIYVGLGRVRLQQKNASDAARWFNEAIQFNPAYEPAYLALIDLHQQSGQGKTGLEVATDGLRHLPESSALKKLYRQLGGKEPFPEPIAKASPPADTVPTKDVLPPAGGGQIDQPAAADEEGPAASADAAAKKEAASIPEGCRFCPPEESRTRWRESFQKAPK